MDGRMGVTKASAFWQRIKVENPRTRNDWKLAEKQAWGSGPLKFSGNDRANPSCAHVDYEPMVASYRGWPLGGVHVTEWADRTTEKQQEGLCQLQNWAAPWWSINPYSC
jgi:hypothetical protein